MNIKINVKNIIYITFGIIILLGLYKPGYVYEVKNLDTMYTIFQFFSLMLCAVIAVKYFRKLFIPEFILIVGIKLYTLLITVLMQGSIQDFGYSFIWILCEIILFSYYLRLKHYLGIKIIYLTLATLVFINLVSIISFPKGMYNFESERIYTFLGHANTTSVFSFPLFVLSIIFIKQNIWKYFSCTNIIICVVSTVLIQSATAFVIYTVFILLNFIFAIKKQFPKRILFTVYVIVMLLSVGIVFFNIQNIFSFLIENILHRELNFTNRDYYWGITINYIKNSFLGYGYVAGTSRIGGLGSHDSLLEILFEGGVFLLFLYTVWFWKISKLLDKARDNEIIKILILSLTATMLNCITESSISDYKWYILYIITINEIYYYKNTALFVKKMNIANPPLDRCRKVENW